MRRVFDCCLSKRNFVYRNALYDYNDETLVPNSLVCTRRRKSMSQEQNGKLEEEDAINMLRMERENLHHSAHYQKSFTSYSFFGVREQLCYFIT